MGSQTFEWGYFIFGVNIFYVKYITQESTK